jgi:thymidine kinase
MFSGKTEELIRRLKSAIRQTKVEIFKPAIDTRYHDEMVVSHNANEIVLPAAANIAILAQVVMLWVDEAQFFDDEIVRVCNDLANRNPCYCSRVGWTLKEILWTHAGSYGYCRIRN